jgi:hypothetical protein
VRRKKLPGVVVGGAVALFILVLVVGVSVGNGVGTGVVALNAGVGAGVVVALERVGTWSSDSFYLYRGTSNSVWTVCLIYLLIALSGRAKLPRACCCCRSRLCRLARLLGYRREEVRRLSFHSKCIWEFLPYQR